MGKEGRPTPIGKASEAANLVISALFAHDHYADINEVLVLGSVWRRLNDAHALVNDVDLLIVTRCSSLSAAVDDLSLLGERLPVAASRVMKRTGWIETTDGVRVELWWSSPDTVGPMSCFLTGPAEFNVWMRLRANRMGLKLSQYGLFRGDERVDRFTGEWLTDEQEVFAALELPWVDGQDREHWRDVYLRKESL